MGKQEINNRIKLFKADLKKSNFSSERIVSKYITFGNPYIFNNDPDKFYELKEGIANYYNIRPSCVKMAGSAKLGFSLKQEKLWEHITLDSDIDAVVISNYLFDDYWKKILSYYNPNQISMLTPEQRNDYTQLRKYLFKGWLRLDLLAPGIPGIKDHFDLTKKLYNVYDNRKVAIGFYRSEDFFEYYHTLNINNIRKTYDK